MSYIVQISIYAIHSCIVIWLPTPKTFGMKIPCSDLDLCKPQLCIEECHRELFELMVWTMRAVNIHWRLLYSHGMWIPRDQAQIAIETGYSMLDARPNMRSPRYVYIYIYRVTDIYLDL